MNPNDSKISQSKGTQGYTLLFRYEESLLHYRRTRNRLNRFCRSRKIAYATIRMMDPLPDIWEKFMHSAKRLKAAENKFRFYLKTLAGRDPLNIEYKGDAFSEIVSLKESNFKLVKQVNELESEVTITRNCFEMVSSKHGELVQLINQLERQRVVDINIKAHLSQRLSTMSQMEREIKSLRSELLIKSKNTDLEFQKRIEAKLQSEKEKQIASLIVDHRLEKEKAYKEFLLEKISLQEKLDIQLALNHSVSSDPPPVKPERKDEQQIKSVGIPVVGTQSHFVKRSHRRLKDIDWRQMSGIKFPRFGVSNKSLTQREIYYNRIISIVEDTSIYANDAVADGLLGNYFSEVIWNNSKSPLALPSSSKV